MVITIKVAMTKEAFAGLIGRMEGVHDEGPEGEGWKSYELDALIAAMDAARADLNEKEDGNAPDAT